MISDTHLARPQDGGSWQIRALWLVSGLVAALCLLPIVAVAIAALTGGTETLSALAATVLPGYIATTVGLVVCVAAGTFALGTGAAWLVTMTEFPGRRWVEIGLVLPFAFPAYVLAYAWTDLLDHPGIVQSTLRAVTGWGPRDYWFPEIRSFGGAAVMLTLVLYPYVYLLARAAFAAQSAAPFMAARALGRSPLQAFLTVSLPMARPAIASGVLLATMETIADYGTVAFFGVQTFATGIYTAWFTLFDRAAAAQLALGLLLIALTLAVLERRNRGRARFDNGRRAGERAPRMQLSRGRGLLALAACLVPILFGVVIPAIALTLMAQGSGQSLLDPRYLGFLRNSVTLAGVAAIVTVTAALTLGILQRLRPTRAAAAARYSGRLGYAVPGGVIAVGLLVPFAAFDNWVDRLFEAQFGIDTGLLLTGSIWALVVAYMIRFLAAALGAYEGGAAAISPNLDRAARVLGSSALGAAIRVQVPLMAPSVLTALLIVFVDVMKELPATLIMRPFNFDTLAVQAHRLASDERLDGAAVPSLAIVAVGLVPVILLCRRMTRRPA